MIYFTIGNYFCTFILSMLQIVSVSLYLYVYFLYKNLIDLYENKSVRKILHYLSNASISFSRKYSP